MEHKLNLNDIGDTAKTGPLANYPARVLYDRMLEAKTLAAKYRSVASHIMDAIAECYHEGIKEDRERKGSSTGIVHVHDGELIVSQTIPKKTIQDDNAVEDLYDILDRAGMDAGDYIRTDYKLTEKAFYQIPLEVRKKYGLELHHFLTCDDTAAPRIEIKL